MDLQTYDQVTSHATRCLELFSAQLEQDQVTHFKLYVLSIMIHLVLHPFHCIHQLNTSHIHYVLPPLHEPQG
jgi:hypothetical protein